MTRSNRSRGSGASNFLRWIYRGHPGRIVAGGFVSGQIGEWFTSGTGETLTRDWTGIWLSCAVLCAACFAVFGLCFPNHPSQRADSQ